MAERPVGLSRHPGGTCSGRGVGGRHVNVGNATPRPIASWGPKAISLGQRPFPPSFPFPFPSLLRGGKVVPYSISERGAWWHRQRLVRSLERCCGVMRRCSWCHSFIAFPMIASPLWCDCSVWGTPGCSIHVVYLPTDVATAERIVTSEEVSPQSGTTLSRCGRVGVGPQLGRAAVVCCCSLLWLTSLTLPRENVGRSRRLASWRCGQCVLLLAAGGGGLVALVVTELSHIVSNLSSWAMFSGFHSVGFLGVSRADTDCCFYNPFLGAVCGGTEVCSFLDLVACLRSRVVLLVGPRPCGGLRWPCLCFSVSTGACRDVVSRPDAEYRNARQLQEKGRDRLVGSGRQIATGLHEGRDGLVSRSRRPSCRDQIATERSIATALVNAAYRTIAFTGCVALEVEVYRLVALCSGDVFLEPLAVVLCVLVGIPERCLSGSGGGIVSVRVSLVPQLRLEALVAVWYVALSAYMRLSPFSGTPIPGSLLREFFGLRACSRRVGVGPQLGRAAVVCSCSLLWLTSLTIPREVVGMSLWLVSWRCGQCVLLLAACGSGLVALAVTEFLTLFLMAHILRVLLGCLVQAPNRWFWFRELFRLSGCVPRCCFYIVFDSAGSTGGMFDPTLVFLLLWLVRDWLSSLRLVREAYPPYSLQVLLEFFFVGSGGGLLWRVLPVSLCCFGRWCKCVAYCLVLVLVALSFLPLGHFVLGRTLWLYRYHCGVAALPYLVFLWLHSRCVSLSDHEDDLVCHIGEHVIHSFVALRALCVLVLAVARRAEPFSGVGLVRVVPVEFSTSACVLCAVVLRPRHVSVVMELAVVTVIQVAMELPVATVIRVATTWCVAFLSRPVNSGFRSAGSLGVPSAGTQPLVLSEVVVPVVRRSFSRGCSVSLMVTPSCFFPTSWGFGMLGACVVRLWSHVVALGFLPATLAGGSLFHLWVWNVVASAAAHVELGAASWSEEEVFLVS
ncbi:hypothetical protein Taro_050242 [Colocasia esculenta]|uniref:Transmembrane protein n=1 Tax=Colocasia esculenta TaxID=4460 RepID=A0A843XDB3_COLES|nr:hypothetical protein [Colocasia esculenta]